MEKQGRGQVDPVLNPLQAEATLNAIQEREGLTLNAEQKAAARMILTTDSRYSGINGYAGTGKTTMLKPAIEACLSGGYRVIGLGPQHSAVHALRDAGIIEARTLQSWLADRQAGKDLTNKTVVVIDEAGLTNAQNLESAMNRIEKSGARAILVGDIKQYESVAAGPAFSLLQKAGMETVYVTEMQRQNKAEANVREAARLSIDSPEKALEKLSIREIKNPQERFKALSEEYLKSKDPKETLVLTGTHEARKAVNENVRKSMGLSGKGNEFSRYEAGDFTEAEKKRIDAYEVKQDIRFGKDYRSMGVKAGEIGRVENVDKEKGTVRLKMEDGRIASITPREMSGKGHEIGKIEQIELSRGDRIRITGNERKKEGITNGMRGEVIESKPDTLRIRLDNGKIFDLNPGSRPVEIDHGYAQTGHSAQGLGAENVIMDLPSNSQTLNRRSFYTNLTRTKGAVIAFTNDREKLTGAVTREKDKTMAHDVEMEVQEKNREIKTKDRPDELRFGETPEQTKARFERKDDDHRILSPEELFAREQAYDKDLNSDTEQPSAEEWSRMPERIRAKYLAGGEFTMEDIKKTAEEVKAALKLMRAEELMRKDDDHRIGKEEKKEVSKEREHIREKDRGRSEELRERRQEKDQEKKEATQISRSRSRDGMGY